MIPRKPGVDRAEDRRSRRSPTTQPVKAAVSIVPSMPMLTTPDRSQTTPHRAPKAIGVAAARMIGALVGQDRDQVADHLEDEPEDRDRVQELVHQEAPTRCRTSG